MQRVDAILALNLLKARSAVEFVTNYLQSTPQATLHAEKMDRLLNAVDLNNAVISDKVIEPPRDMHTDKYLGLVALPEGSTPIIFRKLKNDLRKSLGMEPDMPPFTSQTEKFVFIDTSRWKTSQYRGLATSAGVE